MNRAGRSISPCSMTRSGRVPSSRRPNRPGSRKLSSGLPGVGLAVPFPFVVLAGRGGRGHHRFLAADRRGPLQDDQAAKTKLLSGELLAGSGSEPGASTSPLFEKPAARTALHYGGAYSRVGWTSLPHTPECRFIQQEHTLRKLQRRVAWLCAGRIEKCRLTSLGPLCRRAVQGSSAHRTRPWPRSHSPRGSCRLFSRTPNFVVNTKGRAFRRLTKTRYRTTQGLAGR